MSNKRRARGVKQSELVLPDPDELPFRPEPVEPARQTVLTPRTTTVRNLHAYARDQWAPKPLRGWLALRTSAGFFGIGRTWVPYWCAFDSRYLLLYPTKPGTEESHTATGYSVTTLDPSQARATVAMAPDGHFEVAIPVPSMMIDLGVSTVEALFEGGQLYAVIRRDDFPEYVLCGNHVKYWIHEWQKIGMKWKDEDGKTVDVPTDVVDKTGKVMEPRMDSAERFFLRQQGAFLLYMAGPLQFEAWNSRAGGKWFLHFCTFDAYGSVPKLYIYADGKDPDDDQPPKIVDLTGAVVSEHLDDRQRSKMKIELPGKPQLVCDGPNIQWWLGALQWATRDTTQGKSMFRDLIKHRRFIPQEKSISVLRLQRRQSIQSLNARKRAEDRADDAENGVAMVEMGGDDAEAAKAAAEKDPALKNKLFQSAAPSTTAGRTLAHPGGSGRLTAAEFARQNQSGASPPRARRRSSAPKPDAVAEIRAFERKNSRPLSRAQIPLIELSVGDSEGEGAEPTITFDLPLNESKRKSSKRKSKLPNNGESNDASSAPQATTSANLSSSTTLSVPKSNGNASNDTSESVILSEKDIDVSPRAESSPLAESARKSPRQKSALASD